MRVLELVEVIEKDKFQMPRLDDLGSFQLLGDKRVEFGSPDDGTVFQMLCDLLVGFRPPEFENFEFTDGQSNALQRQYY